MKTKARILGWSFAVVPFVAALGVFCLNQATPQAKAALGPVGWEEMMTVVGGGGEAGCHMAVEDCRHPDAPESSHVLVCPCENYAAETDPIASTKYANATYNVPQDGSPPPAVQNQKYPKITSKPNCTKPIRCKKNVAKEDMKCSGGTCVDSDDDPAMCTDYSEEEYAPWITADEGYCADP